MDTLDRDGSALMTLCGVGWYKPFDQTYNIGKRCRLTCTRHMKSWHFTRLCRSVHPWKIVSGQNFIADAVKSRLNNLEAHPWHAAQANMCWTTSKQLLHSMLSSTASKVVATDMNLAHIYGCAAAGTTGQKQNSVLSACLLCCIQRCQE